MDFSSLGIPNTRTTRVGSRRAGVEIIEAVVRLERWDGYLVKRRENGRAIADGTIVLDFAGTSVSAPEDWDTQVAAYHRLLEERVPRSVPPAVAGGCTR